MWITKYKVHCGRVKDDWLRWNIVDKEFYGGHIKRDATAFVSQRQAKGAIIQHQKMWRAKKYTIHPVKVQVKKNV